MYNQFTWRGTPILDIHAWARERGEVMIRYRATSVQPAVCWNEEGSATPSLNMEVEDGEMPRSFWDGFLWPEGWHAVETGRYAP